MTRYPGGGVVEGGWYLDLRRLALASVPAGGRLPGSSRDSFVRVPWPALLLLAPIAGGAWIVVGPAAGLAAAAWELARKAVGPGSRGRAASGRRRAAGAPPPGRVAEAGHGPGAHPVRPLGRPVR